MNLQDIIAKPQLVKITIDSEEIVKEYGEPLDFWTWDKQPIDTFLKVANAQSTKDMGAIIATVKVLVLNEKGEPIITDGLTMPSYVLLEVINKIVETLGK
jgi:hypothetical protein